MSKHQLYDLLNRCEALLNKVEPTSAGYRMLQIEGLYIEDQNDFYLYIQLGTRFGDGAVVHHEAGNTGTWSEPEVIEALKAVRRHTLLDDLADV